MFSDASYSYQFQPCGIVFNMSVNSIRFDVNGIVLQDISCKLSQYSLSINNCPSLSYYADINISLYTSLTTNPSPGPVFCLLLGVSSDYAQPITGQVTEVTCPVIGQAQPELTPSKRQKTGPGNGRRPHQEWPTLWTHIWITSLQNHCIKQEIKSELDVFGYVVQLLNIKTEWRIYVSVNKPYLF